MPMIKPFIDLDNASFNALFTKADRGNVQAQYELAKYYEYLSVHRYEAFGEINPENEKTIGRWYKLAASQNHPDALYKLGEIYEKRSISMTEIDKRGGIELDKIHERHDFELDEIDERYAPELNKIRELHNIEAHKISDIPPGEIYDGYYIERNKIHKKRAIPLGKAHDRHAFELKEIYENTISNYRLALACYRKAASLQNHRAYRALGRMYEHGKGVHQNFKKASEWYKKASDCGDLLARYSLKLFCENGWVKASVPKPPAPPPLTHNEPRICTQRAYQAHIKRHKHGHVPSATPMTLHATGSKNRRSS